MTSERSTAFSLYLNDVIELIRKPDMSIDEIVSIAKKEWDEISKEIKMFYIEKEVKLYTYKNNFINPFMNFYDN